MQPAIRAFWNSYAAASGVKARRNANCSTLHQLRRSQTIEPEVFESMYQMTQLTPHAIFMLQVSLNILEEPRAAVAELLAM